MYMNCKFELEHIGINTPNAEEAAKLAELLCMMFGLAPRHGNKSEFAGPYFECMKAPFLGANGHIAMRTPDLTAAAETKGERFFFQYGYSSLQRGRHTEKCVSGR